ncbi:MAG: SoxR reducing system RseC family protein [Clostridiales bacterium]|jgi:positive regulator of sigma E activity|nr:SoxR reducing system RseC family protein [Clostridiales bacterium]
MTETALVKKVKDGRAYIELNRSYRCGECNACAFGDSGKITMPALMDADCKPDDTVIVEMPQSVYAWAPVLLFAVPLACFLVGLLVGKILSGELLMILLGFGFAAFGFTGAVIADSFIRRDRRYMPVVTGILSGADKERRR